MKKVKPSKSIKNLIYEATGWGGMAAILTAYFLVSFAVVTPDNIVYQLMNLAGATGILIISIVKKVTSVAALNIFWIIIALYAIATVVL